jgi:hypothetical protein
MMYGVDLITTKNITAPEVHGKSREKGREARKNAKREMELRNGNTERRVERNTTDSIRDLDSC